MPHLGSAVEFQALQLGVSGAAGPSRGPLLLRQDASRGFRSARWVSRAPLQERRGLFQLLGYTLPL